MWGWSGQTNYKTTWIKLTAWTPTRITHFLWTDCPLLGYIKDLDCWMELQLCINVIDENTVEIPATKCDYTVKLHIFHSPKHPKKKTCGCGGHNKCGSCGGNHDSNSNGW